MMGGPFIKTNFNRSVIIQSPNKIIADISSECETVVLISFSQRKVFIRQLILEIFLQKTRIIR